MDTRIALLDSAEHAARQRGFDAFSYADLAKAVGIRKASIHYHFPMKADLAFSLIERYAARFAETLTKIETEHTSAAARLRAYAGVYREALAGGEQVCLCVALSAGRDSLSEPVLAELNQFHVASVAWLEQVFEAGRKDGSVIGIADPAAEAAATLALMEGAQLVARAAKDITLFDQAVAAFLSRLAPTQMH
ncbi:MAG: TetR/AcrR family transcriptional regulator [Pseudomonadota bacterium]